MSDLLIRDVPEDVVAAIDVLASRMGLSRTEYLRRQLSQDAQRASAGVTTVDLQYFSSVFVDLADPDVMGGAWS